VKEQKHFPKNNIQRLLILQEIFGLISLYGFLALPPSESSSIVLMGFSLFRLIIIVVYFSLIILLSFMIFYSFTAASKFENVWNQIAAFLVDRQLLLTTIITVSFIITAASISLELLLDPSIIFHSTYYKYLYDRIRPISLWASVFCGHLFLFVRKQLWITHPIYKDVQNNFGKKEIIILIFIIIPWIEMIILWTRYVDLGGDFVNNHLINTALLVSSIILLLVPIYLNHDSNNKKNKAS